MIAPLPGQLVKNALGRFAAVDDAQDLVVLRQLGGQGLILQLSRLTEGHPAETVIQLRRLGTKLRHRAAGGVGVQQIVQGGLGGGTQHHGRPELLCQRRHGRHAGPQVRQGQHLRLVKDHHAVGQIVELAALGGAVGVHRFEQLHRRGDHHRHVPVLRRQRPAHLLRRRTVLQVKLHPGVMLQHVLLPQNIPKNGGVLVDDGGVRNDIDHTLHPVFLCVAQGKGQRGHRFPAAGGHGQGVYPPGLTALLHAGVQNLAPQPIQLCFRLLPGRDMFLQPG